MKRPIVPFPPDSPKVRFSELLTPYAFQIVRKQIELSGKIANVLEVFSDCDVVTLQTSSGMTHITCTSGTCQFFTMNQLYFCLASQTKSRSIF